MNTPEHRRLGSDFSFLLAAREGRVFASDTLQLLRDVPLVKQVYTNWCGYASLAMLLQFQGYPFTTQDLFRHIHNVEFDANAFTKDQPPAPTYQHLAAVAEELTNGDLQVDFWGKRQYAALQESKPGMTPFDVLDLYLTRYKVPCMVRLPGHNIVTVGVDETSPIHDTFPKVYFFNDPVSNRRRIAHQVDFKFDWGERSLEGDAKHPGDTRYFMLALHKRRN